MEVIAFMGKSPLPTPSLCHQITKTELPPKNNIETNALCSTVTLHVYVHPNNFLISKTEKLHRKTQDYFSLGKHFSQRDSLNLADKPRTFDNFDSFTVYAPTSLVLNY